MDSYKPGSYVTIEEILLAFRGMCAFRMCTYRIKPAKYSFKIVKECDVGTNCMINVIPYLSSNTQGIPLPSHFVGEITGNIQRTNRNVKMDFWFTSVPLAEKPLTSTMNLTIVGTVRKNKNRNSS